MTGLIVAAVAVLVAALMAWAARRCLRRNVMLWLPAYLRKDWPGAKEPLPPHGKTRHVIFAIADHFEPNCDGAGPQTQTERVTQWVAEYAERFSRFRDADGRPPRHTFFYAVEACRKEHLRDLAKLVSEGYGEVEIHLHHRNDTSDNLRRTLREAVALLRGSGHLGEHTAHGGARFAFVHGNWALDNSLPNGDWCGVNDELRILAECGCYADFTLPSAPSAAQTRRINSLYYAADDPHQPKSHDDGQSVRVGGSSSGDLMIVQGPLSLRWPGGRLLGLAPRLEAGSLTALTPPAPARVDAWINTHVCVSGCPEWTFVKVHTHGCADANRAMLLGEPMTALHEHLADNYNDGEHYRLHYVTAREMYNIIRAAERGLTGDPDEYRDNVIAPPPAAGVGGCATTVRTRREPLERHTGSKD